MKTGDLVKKKNWSDDSRRCGIVLKKYRSIHTGLIEGVVVLWADGQRQKCKTHDLEIINESR